MSSRLSAKSAEELQADDIRALVDPQEKRSVRDFSPEELKEICDVSRLPRQLQAKLATREELMPPPEKRGTTIEKQRMIYARLGKQSGLPPGIMWPSRSQVRAAVEDEKTYFSTLQEMIQKIKDKEAETIRAHKQRQEEITEAMKKMPALIEEFQSKLKVEKAEEVERIKKKAEVLEEAQDFFGYAISENDDRIVKFLEQKELEKKQKLKAEVKAKKAVEAEAYLLALARKAAEEAALLASKAEQTTDELETTSAQVLVDQSQNEDLVLDQQFDEIMDELFSKDVSGGSDAPPVGDSELKASEADRTEFENAFVSSTVDEDRTPETVFIASNAEKMTEVVGDELENISSEVLVDQSETDLIVDEQIEQVVNELFSKEDSGLSDADSVVDGEPEELEGLEAVQTEADPTSTVDESKGLEAVQTESEPTSISPTEDADKTTEKL